MVVVVRGGVGGGVGGRSTGWKRRGLGPRNDVAKRSHLRGGQRIIAVFFLTINILIEARSELPCEQRPHFRRVKPEIQHENKTTKILDCSS